MKLYYSLLFWLLFLNNIQAFSLKETWGAKKGQIVSFLVKSTAITVGAGLILWNIYLQKKFNQAEDKFNQEIRKNIIGRETSIRIIDSSFISMSEKLSKLELNKGITVEEFYIRLGNLIERFESFYPRFSNIVNNFYKRMDKESVDENQKLANQLTVLSLKVEALERYINI